MSLEELNEVLATFMGRRDHGSGKDKRGELLCFQEIVRRR
jgi:hypothetical protein